MDLLDEVAQHRFGDLKISDHAIFHGPNGHDISGSAPDHPFGFFANGEHIGGPGLDCNYRGLSQDNPRSRTYTTEFAVPRSIPMSLENRLLNCANMNFS